MTTPSFRTILLATDLSEASSCAVFPALALARKFDSRIVVVYVVEDLLPPMIGEYAAIPFEEVLDSQEQQARAELERFVAEHGIAHAGDEPEQVVRRGIAHLEILKLAEQHEAGLIVMATHGRGMISHALFGSTTERVVRKACCPVLTVRTTP